MPVLSRQMTDPLMMVSTPPNMVSEPGPRRSVIYQHASGLPWVQHVADNFSRCGFRFVPIARRENGFTCSLDILFLRRGHPGELIADGGDIDNRIKVLFDSLKIPRECQEIPDERPAEGEDPFFCLMEDDSLITSVKITTDRLLTPLEGEESESDVELSSM